jgi:sugar (pentulose or hexulose) kinase
VPYFQGSGIPELNEKAEGVYYGINAGHTRGHFIRAIMEGLAIALKRMLECEEKLGATMTEIRSLGGGSKSKAWCQIKADILDMPVKVINNSESTPCMGCAILAGVANGMWNSIDEATEKFVTIKETYYPNPDNKEIYENVYNKYVEVTKALNPTFK